jgi:glutaredoxin
MINKPKLYVKSGCPYCRAAIEWLDEHKVAFERIEVAGNKRRMEELRELSGQTKTPTMQLGGDVLADFGVEQIEPFLRKHKAPIA